MSFITIYFFIHLNFQKLKCYYDLQIDGYEWKSKLIIREFILRLEYEIHSNLPRNLFCKETIINNECFDILWSPKQRLYLSNLVKTYFNYFLRVIPPNIMNEITKNSVENENIWCNRDINFNYNLGAENRKIIINFHNYLDLFMNSYCDFSTNYISKHGVLEVGYFWLLIGNESDKYGTRYYDLPLINLIHPKNEYFLLCEYVMNLYGFVRLRGSFYQMKEYLLSYFIEDNIIINILRLYNMLKHKSFHNSFEIDDNGVVSNNSIEYFISEYLSQLKELELSSGDESSSYETDESSYEDM